MHTKPGLCRCTVAMLYIKISAQAQSQTWNGMMYWSFLTVSIYSHLLRMICVFTLCFRLLLWWDSTEVFNKQTNKQTPWQQKTRCSMCSTVCVCCPSNSDCVCLQGDQSEICGGRDCTVCQCFPAKGARVSPTASTQGVRCSFRF